MSFNGSGTYIPPSGQPVAAGSVIQSSTFNQLVTDIGNTFNNALPRDGQAPMTSQLKLVDGSSTGPGITFNSEQSTGIYRPIAGNLAVVAQGVEVLRLNNLGRMLVGTTIDDGTNKLQVNGPTKITGSITVTGTSTAASHVGPLTGNVTGDLTGNVTGNVSGTAANVTSTVAVANGGTGSTSAAGALTSLGAAPILSPTFTGTVSGITATMVGLGNVTNTNDANKPISIAQQSALNLKANVASPFFSGNSTFGSGTATAYPNLTSLLVQGSQGAVLDFGSSAVGAGGNRVAQLYASAASGLTFATGSSDSIFERVRIDPAGNLLIGKSSLQYPSGNRTSLEVNGSTSVMMAGTVGNGPGHYLYSDLNGTELSGDKRLALTVAGAERMRVSANGNVMIGSQADNGSDKLQVAGGICTGTNGAAGTNSAPARTQIAFRGYQNNRSAAIRSFDQSGTYASGGGLEFLVNSNMTADTLTSALNITASGRLLAGTANDDGVSKLQVTGNVVVTDGVTSIKNTTATASVAETMRLTHLAYSTGNQVGVALKMGYDEIGYGARIVATSDPTMTNAASMTFERGIGNSSYAESMRLSLVGNLLVGTVTDNGSDKVQVNGSMSCAGSVKASGSGGFASGPYVSNTRNPIWRFSNSELYGISYWQGTAGIGGNDTISMHFGTSTVASSAFQFNSNGNLAITGQYIGNGAGLSGTASSLVAGGLVTNPTLNGAVQVARIQGDNGSATAPTYGFKSDNDTGMYSGGDGLLNFCVNSTYVAQFSGNNFTCMGNVAAYSDARLKTNWTNMPADFVESWAKVRAGAYDRIDTGETQIGLAAQDVQAIMPQATPEQADGYLALNYGGAAAVATVELAKEVVALRKLVKMLMDKVGV